MTQYINIDTLLEEINRRLGCYSKCGCEPNDGKWVELMSLKNFINLRTYEYDLEKLVRKVIDLYEQAGPYYDGVIAKERAEHNYSELAIKLLDGVVDTKELSVQYVLDKLKEQKL